MPQPQQLGNPNRQRRGCWLVWTSWCVTLLVAALIYALKAAEERSAFIRWRHQIHELWGGKNIWDTYVFPNPPIMPICLSPLMALPPVVGAMTWFLMKALMATLSIYWCLQLARGSQTKEPVRWWAAGLVILLSLRSMLSDLNHGNINLLILFLVVATLVAWRSSRDWLGGLSLALAISLKVTPALFLPYFAYKRSWRLVAATLVGLVLYFFVIPSVALGPGFNAQCLGMWWHRMLSPFVMGDFISPQEFNQSMGGVVTRLFVEHPAITHPHGYGGVSYQINVVSWPAERVTLLVKEMSVVLVVLLGFFCRGSSQNRKDRRLLGEFSLVALTMLFASERTWKPHYVTLLLPYAYLAYRTAQSDISPAVRRWIWLALVASALSISATSNTVGGWFAGGQGHEIALAYGMYFWGAVILYVAIAWRLRAERDLVEVEKDAPAPGGTPEQKGRVPHIDFGARGAATASWGPQAGVSSE